MFATQAYAKMVKTYQEELEKQRKKDEEEHKRYQEMVQRQKRMLEAAFDGNDDEILAILNAVIALHCELVSYCYQASVLLLWLSCHLFLAGFLTGQTAVIVFTQKLICLECVDLDWFDVTAVLVIGEQCWVVNMLYESSNSSCSDCLA